jgi:mitogen-activated protein kinase kinase
MNPHGAIDDEDEEEEELEQPHRPQPGDEDYEEISQEDCWTIITTFFDEKGLVRQQLDSFDEFVQNTMQELVEESGELVLDQRPMGPRGIRPLPPTPGLSPSPGPPSRNRPVTPRIKLQIPISSNPGYYAGPDPAPQSSTETHDADSEKTIMQSELTSVRQPPSRPETTDDLIQVIADLQLNPPPPPPSQRRDSQSDSEAPAVSDPLPILSNGHTGTSDHPYCDEDFEEIGRLGEGAGGAVHKVREKRSNVIMARKTITTRGAPMRQLLREIVLSSRNQHVNITQFFGAYISPSSSEVKILMEYCEGGSLESIGRKIKDVKGVVGESIAGRLAEGILQGLSYLHSQRIIHRDIKPSNILLSKEGVVKLIDFGVSGELVDSQAGTFTGTGLYMAPERICAQPYTIRSDVWSTGISLLELVQNRFPFPSDLPPIELMIYITQGEPPRLEDDAGVTWSEDMKDFIKQTLTVDPLQRPTPRDLLSHEWIKIVMKQEVPMARWIRKLWGWPTRPRRTRDERESQSRPSSSRRVALDQNNEAS